MNEFRFICARLILYNRVLKILSVPAQSTLKVAHYILHQAVVREHAETTKMRIVYDCSSRANAHSPSLFKSWSALSNNRQVGKSYMVIIMG